MAEVKLIEAEFMRQINLDINVQMIAFRQTGAKPSSKPMMEYYQLDPWEHISMKY